MRKMLSLVVACLCLAASVVHPNFEVNGSFTAAHDQAPQVTHVRLSVRNMFSTPQRFRLEGSNFGQGRCVYEGPLLQPGQQVELELVLPEKVTVVQVIGVRNDFVMNLAQLPSTILPILVINRSDSSLSHEDACVLYEVRFPPQAQPAPGSWIPPEMRPIRERASSVSELITQLQPGKCPSQWRSFCLYTEVWLDAEAEAMLDLDQRKALRQWVDAGGVLYRFGGEETEASAKSIMAGLEISLPLSSRLGGADPRVAAESALLQAARHAKTDKRSFITHTAEFGATAVPLTTRWQHWGGGNSWYGDNYQVSDSPLQSSERVGAIGSLVISTLFVILAGPYCVFMARRRGQPRRLLVWVPTLSAGFCLIMLAYFFFSAGSRRQGITISVTAIDQNTGNGLGQSVTGIFSGLYPSEGFAYNNDTLAVPLAMDNGYNWEVASGTHRLSAGYFRPLVPFPISASRPFATRERLNVRPSTDSASMTVLNGFSRNVVSGAVIYRGQVFPASSIRSGGSAILAPLAGDRSGWERATTLSERVDLLSAQLDGMGSLLSQNPAGAQYLHTMLRQGLGRLHWSDNFYVLVMDGLPEPLDPGLEFSDVGSLHVLVGKLEDAPNAEVGAGMESPQASAEEVAPDEPEGAPETPEIATPADEVEE